jgi:hypothetical protein
MEIFLGGPVDSRRIETYGDESTNNDDDDDNDDVATLKDFLTPWKQLLVLFNLELLPLILSIALSYAMTLTSFVVLANRLYRDPYELTDVFIGIYFIPLGLTAQTIISLAVYVCFFLLLTSHSMTYHTIPYRTIPYHTIPYRTV